MRAMTRTLLSAVLLASLVALVAVPSCGGGGGDQTAKFVGTWTFSSGELTPTCTLLAGVKPFSLGGLTVMFAKVDDATISLGIGAACTVKFKVSGNKATVEPMQTCTLDAGPPLGPVTVGIQSWTLALSGDQIDNMIAGSVAGICTASGTGVLVRGAGDGGVHLPDGGGHDGAGSAGAGGTQEGGATDAPQDIGGAEASPTEGGASEAGADGGTDAAEVSASEAGISEVSAETADTPVGAE
jgi:hypothetical protein